MALTRRGVVAVVAGGLPAGCLSGDGSPDGGGPTPPDGGTTDPPGTDCDPADVSRPPIREDAGHPPQGYGTKPQELTAQSVGDYLADFETAYVWNRILDEHDPVSSLNVDTTTPWTPEATDDGFLASSRLDVEYTVDGADAPTSSTHVASYFVSREAVYRVETAEESVDPRTDPDRLLVQCGSDDANESNRLTAGP